MRSFSRGCQFSGRFKGGHDFSGALIHCFSLFFRINSSIWSIIDPLGHIAPPPWYFAHWCPCHIPPPQGFFLLPSILVFFFTLLNKFVNSVNYWHPCYIAPPPTKISLIRVLVTWPPPPGYFLKIHLYISWKKILYSRIFAFSIWMSSKNLCFASLFLWSISWWTWKRALTKLCSTYFSSLVQFRSVLSQLSSPR